MMRFDIRILLCFLLPIMCNVHAQNKNEYEHRISRAEFPESALETLNNLPENLKKQRFLKELDNSKSSFETKFKHSGQWYSIEFSEQGILEDVEIYTKFKNLSKTVKKSIKTSLDRDYKRHKIFKVQLQFLKDKGATYLLNNQLKNKDLKPDSYEVVAALKDSEGWNLYELTYANNGELLLKRLIERTSYEHILY